jgi:hypothetical protein
VSYEISLVGSSRSSISAAVMSGKPPYWLALAAAAHLDVFGDRRAFCRGVDESAQKMPAPG